MSSVLDRIRRQRQQTEQSEQASLARKAAAAPTPAQVDAAAQATMTQNKGALQPGTLMGSLMDKATGVSTVSRQNIINPRKVEAQKPKQSAAKTVFDVVDRGAGYFNQGVANTLDFVANALPRVEGAITGEEPGATFTGAMLKPATDLTGKLKGWVDQTVEGIDARIQNDTKDSKAAQIAANLGSQAFAALPNTILAFMSGGTSVPGQLATQGSGIAATTTSALQKMASNPMYWTSAAQSLGNNYEAAKASGATDEEAITAAMLSTAFNSAIEVGGGLEKLPNELIGADLSSVQKALQWLKSTLLEEPGEEIVQDVITGLTDAAVFDKEKPMFSTTDENAVINPARMGKTYLESAAVSGLMGGGQVLASNAVNRLTSRNANANVPQQTKVDTPKEDVAAKMAQNIQKDASAQPAQVQPPVQVEPPVAKVEDITPNAAPAVDVDAAVSNVRAEGTGTVGDMGAKPDDAQPAMGAADYGFSPYSNYQNTQSDFLPEGANAARPVDMPATDPTGKPTRRGAKTLYGAQITTDDRAVQMELEFIQGAYGYDVKTNQAAVDQANATLAHDGYDRSYSRVVERLRDLKDLKQTMTEAILLYNDALQNGKDADAAELALLMSMSGTEGGQLVQSFSMFRQLTPEGQLAGVQRVADKLNEKVYGNGKGKRKGGNPIPKYQQASVENEIDDVRETALRLLENVHEALSGRDHGVPVENWIAEIGDKLAKTMDTSKKGGKNTSPTVAKTIQKDLERFAKGYMDKAKPGSNYSNAKALENFLNNRDQYSEAWDTAKQTLREKYKNNPEMLDALNDFLASSIGTEQIGRGIDTDIKKALSDIGVKTSELIRQSDADKADVASKITDMLMKDHLLSEDDASTMASFILERFNQHVAERSEAALKQRFGEKDKKQKKTFEQDFAELANMGAFTNANWKDAVSQKLFGHEITIDPTLVEEFRNAPDQQTRDAVMEKIYKNVGKQIPATFAEAAKQWRYMSMLMNPSTHEKNITNNVAMMAMKVLGKDVVGAGIESATNAVISAANKVTKGKIGNTKIDRTKSILNVFSKNDQKLMQTAWADFENVEDDVAGIGKHKDNAMGKIEEHRDYWKLNNPETKVAKALDKILRTAEKAPKFNSDLMNREDRWFSRPDYAISLAGYMKANNLTEITPEARLYAIKEAQKATFRDANAVSEFAMKMGTNGKLWNGIVNAIFPFKGTPANVGVRAVEYSPVGFLTTVGKAVKASRDGTFKAADFIDDLSANLVGSGLAAAGYFLAQAGLIRSTGVGDEKEKEAQKEAGYKDNSFKLFGYSVPETLITSISTPMFVGAAVYEALATKALDGEAYTIDDVLQAMAATTDPLVGQTMLEGLNDTIYAVRRTQGGPGEWGAAVAVNVAGNFIASFIPTLLSRISAAADGVSRETYVNKDSWVPDSVQKEIQDLMMKTPLRTKLPEKVDNYGRVQENWLSDSDTKIGKALGFVANVVTPTYPSEIKTTDVEAALQDVYRSGADVSDKKIFQTDAPKNITVDGKNVNLTAKQYEHFEKVRGDNTMEYQGGLQNHELFSGLNGDIQAAATDKMYEYIEQISKADLGLGYEPENWVSELANATPDEVAREVIGKALDSVGGYGDKDMEDMYREKIYDPAWSVVDGDILDKAMEYATKFNDAEAKAKMGYEMDADWMLEAKAMGIHAGRTDFFIKKAVEAQAKKVGGTKYEGLEMLLESGEINGKAALLAMPDGAVDAYNEYCSGNYVTPEEWVDVYGYMNSLDGSGSENKEETLKYIDGLKMAPNQKAALAQALYAANPDFIPKTTDIPNEWLLDVGADTSVIVGQFSDSQKEAYSTYIEPAGVGMKWYLDAVEFNGNAKADKNAKGETISGSKRDKVIKHIDSMNIDKAWKRAIYLSLGYSTKNMPISWK